MRLRSRSAREERQQAREMQPTQNMTRPRARRQRRPVQNIGKSRHNRYPSPAF
ncbi:hypothetical protein PI125_g16098 [Phytophthora idaei]|nr:hypothetical protein PI125_g16098 [Phytophthora idaei]